MTKRIKCEDCEWFYEGPGPPTLCSRYPKWIVIEFPHYCGEYKRKKVAGKPDTRRSDLIAYYCEAYKDRFNNAALIQGPDAQAAVAIIKAYGLEDGKMWIDKFLDLDYTPKWNREKRMFRLRDIPAAIQKMSAYDE